MIRAMMIVLAAGLLVLGVLAVTADPHLWGLVLHQLDSSARHAGNQVNGKVARLVTPRRTP